MYRLFKQVVADSSQTFDETVTLLCILSTTYMWLVL